MKKTLLVIVEQHMARLANGEVWTYDMVTAEFWQRYLNVFDRLVVCGRIEQKKDNDTSGLTKSSRPEVEFVDMPNFRGIGGLLKNYFKSSKAIRYAIKKADCIIYRAPSPISMIAYPLCRKSGKPFAFEMMNNPLTQYSKESIDSIVQPLILKFVTRQMQDMCKTANGVSYVTEHTLQELFPCRAMEYPSGNNFTAHYSTINISEEQFCFSEMGKELPRPLTIVHSGKMNDNRKGQDILIKAVKMLCDKGKDVKLYLIGDGVIREKLEQLSRELEVEKNVEFAGWKTGYGEVQSVLMKSHVFAFPSFGEGLPRSVIEAMANGLVTIGSDVDGIKELLPSELMVDKNIPERFADKILHIMEDWQRFEAMRKHTFDKAKCYENKKLSVARNSFYKNLRNCCIENNK